MYLMKTGTVMLSQPGDKKVPHPPNPVYTEAHEPDLKEGKSNDRNVDGTVPGREKNS